MLIDILIIIYSLSSLFAAIMIAYDSRVMDHTKITAIISLGLIVCPVINTFCAITFLQDCYLDFVDRSHED